MSRRRRGRGDGPGGWVDGEQWTRQAVTALQRLDAGLGAARLTLTAALAADWVSDAAEGYRAELADQLRHVDHLLASLDVARHAVTRHTVAAEDARRQAVAG